MCSGAIVKYRFPDAVMYPINYGDEFPFNEIELEDTVYMVDFCLQPFGFMQRLSMLLAGTGELIVIDHHKTTLDKWSKSHTVYGYWLLQTDKAACELTWEYLFPDKPVPLAVKLLSLYDSWRFQGHELEDIVLPFQMRMRMEELDPKDWDYEAGMKGRSLWIKLFSDKKIWHEGFRIDPEDIIDSIVAEGRLLLRYDEWLCDHNNGKALQCEKS
jgi:oligoribonuclease NrnB/cAMP/cGMP phosphodiesterase (DHH superfamily)